MFMGKWAVNGRVENVLEIKRGGLLIHGVLYAIGAASSLMEKNKDFSRT